MDFHEVSPQDQMPPMRSSHESRDRIADWLRLLETSLHRTRDEQVHLRGARESGLRNTRRHRCGKSVATPLKLIRRPVCSEHPTRASRMFTILLTQLRTDRPSWCTRKEPISDSRACIVQLLWSRRLCARPESLADITSDNGWRGRHAGFERTDHRGVAADC